MPRSTSSKLLYPARDVLWDLMNVLHPILVLRHPTSPVQYHGPSVCRPPAPLVISSQSGPHHLTTALVTSKWSCTAACATALRDPDLATPCLMENQLEVLVSVYRLSPSDPPTPCPFRLAGVPRSLDLSKLIGLQTRTSVTFRKATRTRPAFSRTLFSG